MLHVVSPNQAAAEIASLFSHLHTEAELVGIQVAVGRFLSQDIYAEDNIPGFNRSTVDGYAVVAADTFGCSQSLPAILACAGEVEMGRRAQINLDKGACAYVPTGGQLPHKADAMVMIEYCEDYGDGTIGILQAVAPGQNIIFYDDDVKKGQLILSAGTLLKAHDIGALAASGYAEVMVSKPPVIGILSTGDELIDARQKPDIGQIRDVNSYLIYAAVQEIGGQAIMYGICPDKYNLLLEKLKTMSEQCDILLLSGGSSVGIKDAMAKAIDDLGTVHLHGIAIKPGKPTIVGEIAKKPVFGLPGNPMAAYFIYYVFVRPLIQNMLGAKNSLNPSLTAHLGSTIASNHGREELVPVRLEKVDNILIAQPIRGKSGLITLFTQADGYIRIDRDQEGISSGQEVEVVIF